MRTRTLISLFAAIVALLCMSDMASAAQPGPQVEKYRFVLVEKPPVPVGAVVDFVAVNGQVVLQYDQAYGQPGGVIRRLFQLDNTKLDVDGGQQPYAGMRALVLNYEDSLNARNEAMPDGVAEVIHFTKATYRPAAGQATGLERIPYFRAEEAPIPIGSRVGFVNSGLAGGTLSIFWDEVEGDELTTKSYILDGVRFDMTTLPEESNRFVTMYGAPKAGDEAVIVGYIDDRNANDRYGSDGFADSIKLVRVHAWTIDEQLVLAARDEFADELEAQSLFVLPYTGECVQQFKLDGQPLRQGPYGGTFYVPAKGGHLVASYSGCSVEPSPAWEQDVQVGDMISGYGTSINAESVRNANISTWCGYVQNSAPQWQSNSYSHFGCINSRYDYGVQATLPRVGFHFSYMGQDQAIGVVPFVLSSDYVDNVQLPAHTWQAVDQVWLNEVSVYTAQVAADGSLEVNLLSGRDNGTDIYPVRYGDWVAFVPNTTFDKNSQFHWQDYTLCRFVRSGWSEVTPQCVIWQ